MVPRDVKFLSARNTGLVTLVKIGKPLSVSAMLNLEDLMLSQSSNKILSSSATAVIFLGESKTLNCNLSC